MNDLDNLRAFIAGASFNLKGVAEKIGIPRQVLADFMTKKYKTKNGMQPTGLGDHEDVVFQYFRRYGYRDEITYENFL